MRLLVIIAIIAALTMPVRAAEKITIDQLEQMIARHAVQPQPVKHEANSPGEIPDLKDSDLLQQPGGVDDMVLQVAGLELSQRLSTTTMFRVIWKYHLGVKMQQALEQLSDRTALLKLPENEEPRLPAPDPAAQEGMLKSARAYVLQVLSHLPDFMATQTTTRFDDAPPQMKYWQATTAPGLHRVGFVQRQITFRDGKEVTEGGRNPADAKFQAGALESRGEFGTEAAVVAMDVKEGAISFSHWEETMTGPAAVYQYDVPRGSSHYEVNYECGGRRIFHDTPAYHGTIAVDPKTGAVFRMTLEAESKPDDPVSHVASVIEYGPVVLGHQRSICPLRSLAFMVDEADACSERGHKLHRPVKMINQTIFSNYHRFGTSSTIIFNEAESGNTRRNTLSDRPQAGSEDRVAGKPATSGQSRRP